MAHLCSPVVLNATSLLYVSKELWHPQILPKQGKQNWGHTPDRTEHRGHPACPAVCKMDLQKPSRSLSLPGAACLQLCPGHSPALQQGDSLS